MALTPDEWRIRLLNRFQTELPARRDNVSLYESTQPYPAVMGRYRDAYLRLLKIARTPWARLVIDLTEERLQVQGFDLTADSENIDLWGLFRASHMEAMQASVHREALITGQSYVSVWPSASDPSDPQMRFESPLAVTHETVPGDAHKTAAALKLWDDTIEGRWRCNLYLPDRIVKYRSQSRRNNPTLVDQFRDDFLTSSVKWQEIENIPHEYGTPPMVPFTVRPDWQGYGRSDLHDIREVVERIEYLTANTLLAVELGAFRVRWATGLEVPTDENGKPVEPFKAALDRLWISEDPDTKFGSFDYTDIRPYLNAISDAIGQLSAVSRVPPTYFVQQDLSNPPSAASLEASETGLISKIRDRQDRFAESWEQVARLAAVISGMADPGDPMTNVSVLWRDPRTRSDAQVLDAATKMSQIGVPWSEVMAFIGYTPTQIAELQSERAADTFQQLLSGAIPRGQATPLESRPFQPVNQPTPNGDGGPDQS